MPGLVPGIHDLVSIKQKTWMAGTSPAMTLRGTTMIKPPVIDAHAHILAEETIELLAKETPKIAPRLTPIDKDNFELTIAGTPYRPFPRGGFDLEQRFADMQASEVDMHVLSNTPQTFLYNQDAELTTATSVVQNDQIARHVAAHPLASSALPRCRCRRRRLRPTSLRAP